MGKFSEANYNMPQVEQVNTYRNNTAPKAAKFRMGASNAKDIADACEARRANSAQWRRKPTGPSGKRK